MKLRVINPWSWYPLVASDDLAAGSVMPALLHGERLVVWRSNEGKIGVWNDRCPHRSMSLSLGATLGDQLICPYHGWQFGSDGHCSLIPAHPQLTPSRAARARVYPALESNGYIWACLGEPAAAQPDLHLIGEIDLQPARTMHFPADAETLAVLMLAHPLGTPDLGTSDLGTSDRGTSDTGVVTCHEQDGTFVVRHGTAGSDVRLEFPGLITGGGPATGLPAYAALLQPTGDASAAIHLALTGAATPPARHALNDALVRFRRRLPSLLGHEATAHLRSVLVQTVEQEA